MTRVLQEAYWSRAIIVDRRIIVCVCVRYFADRLLTGPSVVSPEPARQCMCIISVWLSVEAVFRIV